MVMSWCVERGGVGCGVYDVGCRMWVGDGGLELVYRFAAVGVGARIRIGFRVWVV